MRPLRTGCWDRWLGQVHKNASFAQTKRSPHRIFPCLTIYFADDLCLLVKRIHLRLHKLGLNSDHVLETLGLAQFVHERKTRSNVLRRVAQEYSIEIRVTPRQH